MNYPIFVHGLAVLSWQWAEGWAGTPCCLHPAAVPCRQQPDALQWQPRARLVQRTICAKVAPL